MLVPDREASISDAQSVFLLPLRRVLYSSLLQWTRLGLPQQSGLLLHFSLSLCQSLIFFLSKLKQLFYKWTPFVPLQNNDLSFRPVKRLVGPELSPHALSSLEIKRKTLRCSHRRDLGPHLATSNDVNNCNAAAKTASSLFLHLCLQKIAD